MNIEYYVYGVNIKMNRQWTKEEANAWYAKLPWLRGCNFIGSDCANRFDMWQSYKAEQKLATAERELALSEKLGFNTVRLWVIFEAWLNEPEFFMDKGRTWAVHIGSLL